MRTAALALAWAFGAVLLTCDLASVAISYAIVRDPAPAVTRMAQQFRFAVGRKWNFGIPLNETPATSSASDSLVVLYTGDNGWAKADRGFAQGFAKAGAPVVSVDSLRYFVSARTPGKAAQDLASLIDTYSKKWNRRRVILVGYSYGGSNLPTIVRNLPVSVRDRVRLVALVAPGENAHLAFDLTAWLDLPLMGATRVSDDLSALRGVRILCVSGARDKESACKRFPTRTVEAITVPGDHRYKGSYQAVVSAILAKTYSG